MPQYGFIKSDCCYEVIEQKARAKIQHVLKMHFVRNWSKLA